LRSHDPLGRLQSQQDLWGLNLTFGYDRAGHRVRRDDSQGGVLTSNYDDADRLLNRTLQVGNTWLRVDLTYTVRDQLDSVTRSKGPGGPQPIVTTAYTYDDAGRLTDVRHGMEPSPMARYHYAYDAAWRLTAETENGVTRTFSYDAADQLTADGPRSFIYDANGNRAMTGYRTGAGNRLLSDGVWTYQYDNEGNRVKKTKGAQQETWTYGYDHDNHL